MVKVLKAIADLLIAGSCYGCGSPSSEAFCLSCADSIQRIKKPICFKCGQPTLLEVDHCRQCRSKRLYFRQARSCVAYEGAVKKALVTLKYETGYRVIDFFVREALLELKDDLIADYVTFIPLSFDKQVSRGHNISELIAKAIAHYTDAKLIDLLKFRKRVVDQAKLTNEQRQKNLKNAFEVKRKTIVKGSILLADDIYTTGTTVNEASRALKNAGFDTRVFTIARTL